MSVKDFRYMYRYCINEKKYDTVNAISIEHAFQTLWIIFLGREIEIK